MVVPEDRGEGPQQGGKLLAMPPAYKEVVSLMTAVIQKLRKVDEPSAQTLQTLLDYIGHMDQRLVDLERCVDRLRHKK